MHRQPVERESLRTFALGLFVWDAAVLEFGPAVRRVRHDNFVVTPGFTWTWVDEAGSPLNLRGERLRSSVWVREPALGAQWRRGRTRLVLVLEDELLERQTRGRERLVERSSVGVGTRRVRHSRRNRQDRHVDGRRDTATVAVERWRRESQLTVGIHGRGERERSDGSEDAVSGAEHLAQEDFDGLASTCTGCGEIKTEDLRGQSIAQQSSERASGVLIQHHSR